MNYQILKTTCIPNDRTSTFAVRGEWEILTPDTLDKWLKEIELRTIILKKDEVYEELDMQETKHVIRCNGIVYYILDIVFNRLVEGGYIKKV
jgi:hypothetical protein